MAKFTFNFTSDPSRSDVYAVDPVDVKLVHNGRRFGLDPAKVRARADSIKRVGQLQPGLCRKDKTTGDLILVAGNYRHAACTLLRGEDEKIRFYTRIDANLSEKDAFLLNQTENIERQENSIIDDSYNMDRMMKLYSFTIEQLAEFYKCSEASVRQRLELKALEDDAQRLVESGDIGLVQALKMLKLPAEKRAEIVAVVKAQSDAKRALAEKEAEDALGSPVVPSDAAPDASRTSSDAPGTSADGPSIEKTSGNPKLPTRAGATSAVNGNGAPSAPSPAPPARTPPAPSTPKTGDLIDGALRDSGTKVSRNMATLRKWLKEYAGNPVQDAMLKFIDGDIDEEKFTKVLDVANDAILEADEQRKTVRSEKRAGKTK